MTSEQKGVDVLAVIEAARMVVDRWGSLPPEMMVAAFADGDLDGLDWSDEVNRLSDACEELDAAIAAMDSQP